MVFTKFRNGIAVSLVLGITAIGASAAIYEDPGKRFGREKHDENSKKAKRDQPA